MVITINDKVHNSLGESHKMTSAPPSYNYQGLAIPQMALGFPKALQNTAFGNLDPDLISKYLDEQLWSENSRVSADSADEKAALRPLMGMNDRLFNGEIRHADTSFRHPTVNKQTAHN